MPLPRQNAGIGCVCHLASQGSYHGSFLFLSAKIPKKKFPPGTGQNPRNAGFRAHQGMPPGLPDTLKNEMSVYTTRSGVRGLNPADHFISFRIRIASHAALSPLSTPTAATGTPLGIWAMARRASRPLRVPLTGTPMTGLSVFDAITPGSGVM
jgi:hypothetical protein